MDIDSDRHRKTTPATRTPRGRPKDHGKRAAVLGAAKALFARHGYDGISMDAIAAEAGVSKLTLYNHFHSKDALFQNAVEEKCRDYTPEDFFDAASPLPLRARLLAIGRGFAKLLMNREAVDFYRLLAAQAGSGPHLGRLFFAAGPARNLAHMSQLLRHADAAGELRVPDPTRAAGHFFCLLQGVPHLRILIGESVKIPDREMRAHVADAVEVFLRAYRA